MSVAVVKNTKNGFPFSFTILVAIPIMVQANMRPGEEKGQEVTMSYNRDYYKTTKHQN